MNEDVERATLPRLIEEIARYCDRYGVKPAAPLSRRYDLHREWQEMTIPYADSPGCYFIFDDQDVLLYVGKASLRSTIGRRVCTYFEWAGEKLKNRHAGWTGEPAYLRTLPVSQGFEAASLEEYLIDRLQPQDNTRK